MNLEPSSASNRLQAALSSLVEKYSVPAPPGWTLQSAPDLAAGSRVLFPGWIACQNPLPNNAVPLLPWRSQRRFVELKRVVDDEVVAPVLMARFFCHTDGAVLNLAGVLYRQFDLAEWLLGQRIETVTASIHQHAANVILRMTNAVVCGIEAGAALPRGTPMLDRHELIARRGVACDRVVDTQVPQQSVYLFTPQATQTYTDTDAELFGMADDEVALVRAALDTLKVFDQAAELLRQQHARLSRLVSLAFESDRLGKQIRC